MRFKYFISVVFLFLICGCSVKSASNYSKSEYENICYRFVVKNMIEAGGVHTNYLNMPYEDEKATGYDVLSESQGLIMEYASLTQDYKLFKSSLKFVEKNLNLPQILLYRYSNSGRKFTVNAAIDDLRIIKALIYASDVFSRKYNHMAKKFSDRFYSTNVKDYFLYDFYDINTSNTNEFITLCYIDLKTMNLISNWNSDWQNVYDNMLNILKNGYIDDQFPMFMTSYNYSSKEYEYKSGINMVESLLCALHLSEVKQCPDTTLNYIRDMVKGDCLYGMYSIKGDKMNDLKSTAIYAICAAIAKSENDIQMYTESIDRMNQFLVKDKSNPIYGAFGNVETLEVYSFDNLTALIAYSLR